MTHVTAYYNLGLMQGGVDFVDVDVDTDVPVYICPTAIRHQTGPWAESCVNDLQTYFSALLAAIASKDETKLAALIVPLTEPNETHLGQSKGASRGRSLGSKAKADELIDSLRSSKAASSGFLTDLEDTALMVDGIGKDIISDIATCVIRKRLIAYTQSQCQLHGIPLVTQNSGPFWDSSTTSWTDLDVALPRAADDRLILVPKSVVRVSLTVDQGRYYRGYLRPYFEDDVLANSRLGLLKTLKNGSVQVALGKLDKELGTSKDDIIRHTEKFPSALTDYREKLGEEDKGPLSDEALAEQIGAEVEELREILAEMRAVAPGQDGATLYHRCVARLFSRLFSTSLGNGDVETAIHGGMKRIDITYDNIARHGFFAWLAAHYPAAMIVTECKNYGRDAANPEFDQLAMRFSPTRGRIGILACRSFQDKSAALRRAKNIATDSNGFVIVLDDADLSELVDNFEAADGNAEQRARYPLLRARFQSLID